MTKQIEKSLRKFLLLSDKELIPEAPMTEKLVKCLLRGEWREIKQMINPQMAEIIKASEGFGYLGERGPITMDILVECAKKENLLQEVESWSREEDEMGALERALRSKLAEIVIRCCDKEILKRKWKRQLENV